MERSPSVEVDIMSDGERLQLRPGFLAETVLVAVAGHAPQIGVEQNGLLDQKPAGPQLVAGRVQPGDARADEEHFSDGPISPITPHRHPPTPPAHSHRWPPSAEHADLRGGCGPGCATIPSIAPGDASVDRFPWTGRRAWSRRAAARARGVPVRRRFTAELGVVAVTVPGGALAASAGPAGLRRVSRRLADAADAAVYAAQRAGQDTVCTGRVRPSVNLGVRRGSAASSAPDPVPDLSGRDRWRRRAVTGHRTRHTAAGLRVPGWALRL